jgi:hypothetical protein
MPIAHTLVFVPALSLRDNWLIRSSDASLISVCDVSCLSILVLRMAVRPPRALGDENQGSRERYLQDRRSANRVKGSHRSGTCQPRRRRCSPPLPELFGYSNSQMTRAECAAKPERQANATFLGASVGRTYLKSR